MSTPVPVRVRTYLSPSLPLGLFEAVVAQAARLLGRPITLESEVRWSGPEPGSDPFAAGEVDVAFLCSPSYLRLTHRSDSAAGLLPFAPVFDDPRADGMPRYFSDVVVRCDSDARSLPELAGATWAYNDTCSLSGYWGMHKALRAQELGADHFGRLLHAGSHLDAVAAVASGAADVAAIDSNALRLLAKRSPALAAQLRCIRSVGPHPIQPIAIRRGLDLRVKTAFTAVLRNARRDTRFREALAPFGVTGFAPVDHAFYAAEVAELTACGALAA